MNYCQICRRHLNGAYSCPGCGATVDRPAESPVADTVQLPAVPGEEGTASGSAEGPDGRMPGAGRGRQRVAVYGVGAVALLGALTMFSMAAFSGPDGTGDGPSSVPPVHGLPVPTGRAASPDEAGRATTPSGPPPTSASTPGMPTGSVSASGTASPGPTVVPGTIAPRTSAPGTPTATVTATETATPTATGTAAPPRTDPPPPSPTETPCTRVLWWCA